MGHRGRFLSHLESITFSELAARSRDSTIQCPFSVAASLSSTDGRLSRHHAPPDGAALVPKVVPHDVFNVLELQEPCVDFRQASGIGRVGVGGAVLSVDTQFDVCPAGRYNCRVDFLGRTAVPARKGSREPRKAN